MTLVLDSLRITLGQRDLLTISAEIPRGQILTLMGPSGSGKSSLLNAISGHLPRDMMLSGSVMLDGRSVLHLPPNRRNIGMMFQDPYLFPHMSVASNLAYGIPARTRNRSELISSALRNAELDGYGTHDPATLSGGQRTRVALMRCLLAQPRALLLDEPFSNLDMGLRTKIRSFVFREVQRHNLPCILVTHDAADAEATKGPVMTIGQE